MKITKAKKKQKKNEAKLNEIKENRIKWPCEVNTKEATSQPMQCFDTKQLNGLVLTRNQTPEYTVSLKVVAATAACVPHRMPHRTVATLFFLCILFYLFFYLLINKTTLATTTTTTVTKTMPTTMIRVFWCRNESESKMWSKWYFWYF